MRLIFLTTICISVSAHAGVTPLSSPVKECKPITPGSDKDYGMRKHPMTGQRHQHSGVDLTAPAGTDYLSPGDGVVTRVGKLGGRYAKCGQVIEVQHGPKLFTHSCHMKKGAFTVKVGDKVTKGQKLAEVGATGRCTGAHSHFVVKTSPEFDTHVDPFKFVDGFCGLSRSKARPGQYGPETESAEKGAIE